MRGEIVSGLALVWVHPYQAPISSMDEVARKLTLLTTLGGNWAYSFVQFNEDAQHVPLPKAGHLSAMIDGKPSRNMCGHLCQLEVCQLLQSENQVVYPKGLNGALELVLTSLPESLTHGMMMLNDPVFLLVDLSSFMPGTQNPSSPQDHDTYFPYSSHYGISP